MSLQTIVRYALFFALGYTLSVVVIQACGVDKALSRGRWVQHVESNAPPEFEDGNHAFPQHAQRRGKNHENVREAFLPAAEHAKQATIVLLQGDRQIALATVVRGDGWAVSKASEIPKELPHDTIEALLPNGIRTQARRMAIDAAHDLALFQLSRYEDVAAAPWATQTQDVPVGSLVFSTGSPTMPIAIGVVSVPLIDIPRQAGVLGIQMGQGRKGPVVTKILPGGAASESELATEDMILSVDNTRVHTIRELSQTIRDYWPGDKVDLRVERKGEESTVTVRLGRKEDLDLENRDFLHELGGPLSNRRSGFGQVIQHDTILTPEQCGGPLVDVEGHVVGVNIARAERVSSYALPAHVVQDVVRELFNKIQATVPAATTSRPDQP